MGERPIQPGASASPAAPSDTHHEEFDCLQADHLEEYLERRRAKPSFPLEVSLRHNLIEVLRKANEFVPSSAGSILLDHPLTKDADRHRNSLTFIAGFGAGATRLLGRRIPADRGIAGHVYLSGEAYATSDAQNDPLFYAKVDHLTEVSTRSLVAIPVRIEQDVCGVLELINRLPGGGYTENDTNLLEIFAGHISITIENVLDGRQAHEIAKRDTLTSLYNDRYLHVALSRSLEQCRQADEDLALLFLDLDNFKRVNDTHGHLAGSQVLREVGRLLSGQIRGTRALAARYGGDEFVLVLPGYGLETAVDVAERARLAIVDAVFCDGPSEIQPQPLFLTGITCSVGVATVHRHLVDETNPARAKSTLLRLADAAMYVAKETGRNRTVMAGEPVRRRPAPFD